MEVVDGRAYRWTKRHATLQMTPSDGRIIVEASSSAPGDEQVLAVRVNGYLVGNATLDESWREHAFPVPPAVPRDRPIEVALDVNFELPPSVKGSDARQLGAKITRVEFA